MIGTSPNSNGRTGTQILLSGIGVALAVLVMASMLAAPAAADPAKESEWKSTDGEDVHERHFEDVDGEDVVLGVGYLKFADLADGEDVLKSHNSACGCVGPAIDSPDVLESVTGIGPFVVHTDSGDYDSTDS